MATTARVSTWRQWVEAWYLTYALLGATIAGLAPILLPLTVSRIGSAAKVGLVMAAFNLGGLTAPWWGGLADHYRLHRVLLTSGLLTAAIGLSAFAFTTISVAWLALLISIGAAGAATVANLFVVEAHPPSEWDERISWLQTFYGVGQVGGLLLAGALSQIDLRTGLLIAAALTAVAALVGWLTTRTPPRAMLTRPVLLYPARHGEWALSPQRLFHHLSGAALRTLGPALLSPFGLFLFVWLISFAGAAAVFSLYPVMMQQAYGVAPGVSSLAFAVAAGLGLALYTPAGRWSERFGASRVLRFGLGLRLIAFLCLSVLGLAHGSSQGWLALTGFALVVLAWSLLNVSGTAITAQLAPVGEGASMGIFNATTAVAGVVGAALGGWAATRWGYNAVSELAAVGVALGLLLALITRPAHSRPGDTASGPVHR